MKLVGMGLALLGTILGGVAVAHGANVSSVTNRLRVLTTDYSTVTTLQVGPFAPPGTGTVPVPAMFDIRNTGTSVPHFVLSVDSFGSWTPNTVSASVGQTRSVVLHALPPTVRSTHGISVL